MKHPAEDEKCAQLFAGTEGGGLFRSIDNGGNWAPLNTGLPNQSLVRALAVSANGYVFAGTIGTGVFRSAQPTTSVNAPATSLPDDFSLAQNFPNPFGRLPFNPTTTIAFTLPRLNHVTLKVFNQLGEEVATLVDQKLPAGRHQAPLDASGWPSGVYFYRLQAEDNFIATRKLILVK
jgi:hypothetical protein